MNLDPLLNVVIEGRYRITSRLARGGMASVYRAHDTRLDRDVAVKVIHSHLAEQPDFVERFIREARSAAKLTNPHVVNVYDQGVAQTPLGDLPYLVMQLVRGPDLRSELTANGSLPVGMALTIVKQVLQALATAHRADIVHRDVKPENILLAHPLDISAVISQPTITAQVADFGLARAASKSTQTATVLGTVGYVAPELVTAGTAGPATDIYATGIMLYELIAGSLPFNGETPLAVAYQHVHDQVPPLHDLADWMPASIDSLIRLFTAKDPQKRPQNGQAALDALEDITDSLPANIAIRRIPVFPQQVKETSISATTQQLTNPVIEHSSANTQKLTTASLPTSDSLPSTTKTRRRRRWPLFTAIFLLLLSVTGGAGWYFLYGPGLRVTLADVSAMSLAQAQETLEKQGFQTSVEHEFSDTVAKDSVIGTDPTAGSRIHPDTAITIRISDGIKHLTVPSLVGLTSSQASQALTDAGFSDVTHTSEYSDTVEKDHVISQVPEADSSVPHNSAINVVVSDGRAPVKIPDLTDVKRGALEQTLSDLGLTLVLTEEYSDTVAEGSVISQSPEANSDGLRLDEVHVTVSLGPKLVEVPNVIGQQSQNAVTTLKNAGFDVKVEKILGGFFGTVRLQDPEGGTKAKPGTTITITVV